MPNSGPNALKRAYCLPDEYCIYYRHNLRPDQPDLIADGATTKLLKAMDALNKKTSPLYNVLESKNAADPNDRLFSFNVNRVHTADPRRKKANRISLVIIELKPPKGYASWEDLYKLMARGTSAQRRDARAEYMNARLNVVKSIAELYKPGDVPYPTSGGNFSTDFFKKQNVIIDTLNDPTNPDEGIIAVSPHWRVFPSPNDGPPPLDSGGPGARPGPYNAIGATLEFNPSDGGARWWEAGTEAHDVHVVVLDSIPDVATIADAQNAVRNVGALAKAKQGELLLEKVLGNQRLTQVTPANIPDIDTDVGNVYRTDKFHALYDKAAPQNVLPTSNPARRPASYAQGHNYHMADHGLFISGIIGTIEPDANIYLVQVLNEYGIGNLETVWCGFLRYWNYLYLLDKNGLLNEPLSKMRLVFNCSLGFDAPSSVDMLRLEEAVKRAATRRATPKDRRAARYHTKLGRELNQDPLFKSFLASFTGAGAADPLAATLSAITAHEFAALLWPSFAGIQRFFTPDFFDIWRQDEPDSAHQGEEREQPDKNLHLMLAAAGNGRRVGKIHPSAYFPASDPAVIGVGALRMPDPPPVGIARSDPAMERIAEYSNIADAPPDAGYFVFGGQANPQPANEDEDSPDTDIDKGIVGIYLGNLPNGNPPAQKLAEWAGTSFATPILSGIIAAIFRRDQGHPFTVLRNNRKVENRPEARLNYMPLSVNSLNPTPITAAAVGPIAPKMDLNIIQVIQDR